MWHILGVKTYADPSYIFSGASRPQPPVSYATEQLACNTYEYLKTLITLRDSCGAVYCNRSYLWVCGCVCLFEGLLPWYWVYR